MNKAEYARHRGVFATQVRRALALGWITYEPDGSIDAAKADRSWAASADPAHPRGKEDSTPSTYIDARLANQLTTTEERAFKLKQERAGLVSRRDATDAIRLLADRARSSWAPWSERIAPRLAHDLGIDADLVRQVLGRYVKEQLASLPPITIELR